MKKAGHFVSQLFQDNTCRKKERALRQYHSRILKLPDDELHNQNMTGTEAT